MGFALPLGYVGSWALATAAALALPSGVPDPHAETEKEAEEKAALLLGPLEAKLKREASGTVNPLTGGAVEDGVPVFSIYHERGYAPSCTWSEEEGVCEPSYGELFASNSSSQQDRVLSPQLRPLYKTVTTAHSLLKRSAFSISKGVLSLSGTSMPSSVRK